MLVIFLYLKSVIYRKACYRKHNTFLNHMTIAYIKPNFWFMVLYSIYAKLLVLLRKSNFFKKILSKVGYTPHSGGLFKTPCPLRKIYDYCLWCAKNGLCSCVQDNEIVLPTLWQCPPSGEHMWLASSKYTKDMPKYPELF